MLTAKQQRFVEEYLVDLNATQAAIRAGYSKNGAEVQGHRLLTNANVRASVDEARAKVSKRIEVDQDYVLETILGTVERCKQAKPVLDRRGDPVLVDTPDGSIVPAYQFDAKSVLRGAELLGKHLGMFKERVEHSGPDGAPIEISNMEAARRIAFLLSSAAKQA